MFWIPYVHDEVWLSFGKVSWGGAVMWLEVSMAHIARPSIKLWGMWLQVLRSFQFVW